MELKLFGKKIFEFSSGSRDVLLYNSQESLNKSKFLPDFLSMRENQLENWGMLQVAEVTNSVEGVTPKKKKKERAVRTPKQLFELKFLNKKNFTFNADINYINDQIQQFKDKLNLIKITEFDMSRGTNEISSLLVRLENRKKYKENEKFFEEYAYTTTERINSVVKNHSNLKLGKIEQFIADMPKEAITAMKDYTTTTEKICKKKPIFYIIADKKDFEKTDKRRDPILLAQSPFGHFWQILGAWDEEMLFLGDL